MKVMAFQSMQLFMCNQGTIVDRQSAHACNRRAEATCTILIVMTICIVPVLDYVLLSFQHVTCLAHWYKVQCKGMLSSFHHGITNYKPQIIAKNSFKIADHVWPRYP